MKTARSKLQQSFDWSNRLAARIILSDPVRYTGLQLEWARIWQARHSQDPAANRVEELGFLPRRGPAERPLAAKAIPPALAQPGDFPDTKEMRSHDVIPIGAHARRPQMKLIG